MRRTGHLEAALMSSYIIQLLSSRATDYGYNMDLQMPEVGRRHPKQKLPLRFSLHVDFFIRPLSAYIYLRLRLLFILETNP